MRTLRVDFRPCCHRPATSITGAVGMCSSLLWWLWLRVPVSTMPAPSLLSSLSCMIILSIELPPYTYYSFIILTNEHTANLPLPTCLPRNVNIYHVHETQQLDCLSYPSCVYGYLYVYLLVHQSVLCICLPISLPLPLPFFLPLPLSACLQACLPVSVYFLPCLCLFSSQSLCRLAATYMCAHLLADAISLEDKVR